MRDLPVDLLLVPSLPLRFKREACLPVDKWCKGKGCNAFMDHCDLGAVFIWCNVSVLIVLLNISLRIFCRNSKPTHSSLIRR